jgi:hypothetical protein
MSKESRFNVVKGDGAERKYLRHEGHKHFWSTQKRDAMEYTKIEVAQALANQNGGKVDAA